MLALIRSGGLKDRCWSIWEVDGPLFHGVLLVLLGKAARSFIHSSLLA